MVDQIALRKLGGFNFIEPKDWFEMPSSEQAELIKGGRVEFLYQGDHVPVRKALEWLQEERSTFYRD